jgi:hypothetical protein
VLRFDGRGAETDTNMQRDRETEREEEWKFEISN